MGKKASAVIDDMKSCYVCGSPYIEIHHIIHGTANRKISDRYGYIMPLCHEHHQGDTGIHYDKNFSIKMKQMCQEHFEKHHGSRTDFIHTFGKSYL